jgi:hypothetical protein
MNTCTAEEHRFKMCKLLLEEFREGLWSREDYHEQIKKLDVSDTPPP